jgi:ABC-2 type transport system ATP-binding protein
MNEPVILLDGLTKSYGKHRGIENISFSVAQGEIFGFIGPNGAGKSTTIRTLMGLLKPTGGKASIFGLDCGQYAAEIAKDVGYLPSENCYYNNLKVREMLQYTADLYGVDGRSRMGELAERLNLDLSRRIGDLSLGNKKKVGIVSALLPAPKLLIMDEPTNGLDPLVQQTFNQILQEENEHGTTIFLSSHVLSEVQKLCDRVAILREGKLIGLQSMKELRENGYKRISVSTKEAIAKDFFAIPGVADLKQEHRSASFIFNGNAMTIMNKLCQLELEDILIEEPSLEEIFLHYYE